MSLTRTNETAKLSADILKQVDQLVKSNNLERALNEVKKAREIDPKNVYAFAYEERIQELFAKRQIQHALNPQTAFPHAPVIEAKSSQPAVSDSGVKTDMYGMKIPSLYEEFKKVGLQGLEKPGAAPQEIQHATKEALETYKQALLLIWSDGQKTEEDDRELLDLRKSFFITEEEHVALENQAKLECYILLLKHVLQSPASKSEVEASLAELRHNFDVSASDHRHIEANLQTLKKEKKHSILVIDDDKQILSMITEFLTLAQYDVKDFTTSDEALEYLKKNRADLVLCDISLDTSTMNGFLFYEQLERLQHLRQMPFIFITGLNDALLIRAAKEMGVDDFLIKPIRRENLLATIHGRIKRYEQMKILSGI